MEVRRKITVETEMFEVGDVIKFKLTNGEKVKAMAVRETSEGMLFMGGFLLPSVGVAGAVCTALFVLVYRFPCLASLRGSVGRSVALWRGFVGLRVPFRGSCKM